MNAARLKAALGRVVVNEDCKAVTRFFGCAREAELIDVSSDERVKKARTSREMIDRSLLSGKIRRDHVR